MAGRATVKVPKGTRDLEPRTMAVRRRVFDMISRTFEQHGAVSIETPVFELKSTLTNKYGEDSKLIYDLADQGGEMLSLRYDLTVPFARYLASHKVSNIRRYNIARVYRRDNPAMNRGRFREFYQCDFDIAGDYPAMVPDAEILTVLSRQLSGLAAASQWHAKRLGSYLVKVNHRGLLDAFFQLCGVPEPMLRTICSAVDKLDKEPWEAVRREMVDVKGLDPDVADRIQHYVSIRGAPSEVLSKLEADEPLVAKAAQPLAQLRSLFDYLEVMNPSSSPVSERFSLDLSLARGLDYYTGVIFEAVLTDPSAKHLGSVAAGGRYDSLVGMFSGKPVPCVGCSLGIERLMDIYEEAEKERAAAEDKGVVRETVTQVLVASVPMGADPESMMKERMRVCSELWACGLAAEFSYKRNPKLPKQLEYAVESGIPVAVIIGQEEIEQKQVKIKNLRKSEQSTVPREELVTAVRAALDDLK